MVSAQLNNIHYTQILRSKGYVFNSSPARSSFNVICGGLVSPSLYQGSLLSPVLFLVWLALILVEIERQIRKEVPGIGVKFPSYVDDLHCGLYDDRGPCRHMDEVERREEMEDLIGRVSVLLKEVAAKR